MANQRGLRMCSYHQQVCMVKKFTLADLGIPSETMGFGTPSIYYEVLMIATSLELYGRLQSEVGVASKKFAPPRHEVRALCTDEVYHIQLCSYWG